MHAAAATAAAGLLQTMPTSCGQDQMDGGGPGPWSCTIWFDFKMWSMLTLNYDW